VKTPLLIVFTLLTFAAVTPYFYLTQKYVKSTPIPDKHPLTVIIGEVRSKYALDNLQSYTDAEMLKALGPYEESVQKLWTEDSILRVRLRLFLSYSGLLFSLNFILGICAREDSSP
jgi:hypothetical protein